MEGWIDNVYGPTGAVVGVGAGLIRTLNIDEDCTAELVPVDFTVNALIATAWDVANKKSVDFFSLHFLFFYRRITQVFVFEGTKRPIHRSTIIPRRGTMTL